MKFCHGYNVILLMGFIYPVLLHRLEQKEMWNITLLMGLALFFRNILKVALKLH